MNLVDGGRLHPTFRPVRAQSGVYENSLGILQIAPGHNENIYVADADIIRVFDLK
jgi:hypothetical protein